MLASLLNGCAERADESLVYSLNHRYQYEKVNGENGSLYSALSLTGLLPTEKLGAPYYFTPQEGMDASFEIGGDRTLYMSQTIGDDITRADVQAVSQKILELKQMCNRALYAKLNLIKAQKDKDAPLASKYLIIYQAALENLDKAHRAVMAALKPGIVILQWENSNNDQDRFSLTSGNSFHYNYGDKFKGLLVLGGIRISKLSSIGKDFCSRLETLNKTKGFCDLKQNIVIPTYLLQTRHLVFIDQFQDVAKDSIMVALDQALKSNALSILDTIELESIHKQAYSLWGLGELSGMRTTYEPGYPSFPESGSWITIYAVLPSAENLYSKFGKWCS